MAHVGFSLSFELLKSPLCSTKRNAAEFSCSFNVEGGRNKANRNLQSRERNPGNPMSLHGNIVFA